MNQKTFTKIFAANLSLALAVTSAPLPASALGPVAMAEPAFVAKMAPPDQLGYVSSSFAPAGADRPRLIVIADLHGHAEVQEHITDMLEHFVNILTSNKAGAPETRVPIYVEGGWADHLEEPLTFVKKDRRLVAEYLLKKNELHPAQLYSERHVGSGKVRITGVENKSEYETNIARFKDSYPMRKTLLEAFARHEDALNELRDIIEPSSVKKLHSLREDYDHGKVSSTRYAAILSHLAVRNGIHNPDVDTLLQAEKASEGDLAIALSSVHAQVTAKLSQSKPLSAYLRREMDKEDLIRRNVAQVDSTLDLLKRLVGDQLTPEEVPYALSQMPKLAQVAQLMIGDEKLNFDIQEALSKALEFYPFAILRDQSLLNNSLAAMNKDDTHPATGILVVGGFHTGAIVDSLRQQNIPFMLVNPTINRDLTASEQLTYIKRVFGEHVTPQEVAWDMSQPWGKALSQQAIEPAPISEARNRTNTPGEIAEAVGFLGSGMSAALNPAQIASGETTIVKSMFQAPEVPATAQGAARVQRVVEALGGNGKMLAKQIVIDPNLGVSLKYEDGNFVAEDVVGDQKVADAIQAKVNFVNGLFKQQREQEGWDFNVDQGMDFQGVDGAVLTQFSVHGDANVQIHKDDFVIVNPRGVDAAGNKVRPIVLFNVKKVQDGSVEMFHEILHAFTPEGRLAWVGENRNQVNALAVAAAAEVAGLQDAASLGTALLAAQAMSGAALANFFYGLSTHQIPGEANTQRSNLIKIARALQAESSPISFQRLQEILVGVLAPAKLDEPRMKEFEAKLSAENPELTEFQIGQVIEKVANSWSVKIDGVTPETQRRIEEIVRQMAAQARAGAWRDIVKSA